MVCCTLIAGLLGLLLAPWRRRGALDWRLGQGAPHGFLERRLRSVGYALAGLAFAIRTETNMRIHLAAATAAIAAGVALPITADEWRWLVAAICLVIAGEALNTGIEQACNAIGGRNEPIRRAKDAAAGGVLVLALAAAWIGASIFLPHLIAAWRHGLPPLTLCGVR